MRLASAGGSREREVGEHPITADAAADARHEVLRPAVAIADFVRQSDSRLQKAPAPGLIDRPRPDRQEDELRACQARGERPPENLERKLGGTNMLVVEHPCPCDDQSPDLPQTAPRVEEAAELARTWPYLFRRVNPTASTP